MTDTSNLRPAGSLGNVLVFRSDSLSDISLYSENVSLIGSEKVKVFALLGLSKNYDIFRYSHNSPVKFERCLESQLLSLLG